jgi:hypothetical protein
MRYSLPERRRPPPDRRWKVGGGDDERIGHEIAVGHLTSETTLQDGEVYSGGGTDLHADVELAVELGFGSEAHRYGVALEICDLADGGSPEEIVAKNDYHRAVAFGPFASELPDTLEAALIVNGQRREAGPAPTAGEAAARVRAVERVLRAVDEELRPGDRIITGLIVNCSVRSGDEVSADLGALGRVQLRLA